MRKAALFLIAALLLAGGWWLWSGDDTPAKSPAEIPSAVVTRETIAPTLLLSGEVTPAFQVEVRPEVGGRVKAIHVVPGQKVKKGDLLLTIDDTDLLNEKAAAETEIEGSEIALRKNQGNYERARALFEEKLISKEVFANLEADFLLAENTLEKSRRRLRSVEDRLSKTRILSPGDGTILSVNVSVGQVVVAAASVNSGTALLLFADLSQLMILSHVNQIDAPKIPLGTEVTVSFSGQEGAAAKARVEFMAPVATVKNNIKGFEMRALVDEVDARLKPGISVSMEAPLGRSEQALSVPVSAIFRERGQRFAYVHRDGRNEKREVSTGLNDLSRIEVLTGLQEGERVLLAEPPAETLKASP